MLLTATLMTMTVSAVTNMLNDAQWSSMVIEPHNEYFNGSITGVTDYPRDPGYRWDLNVVKSGGAYGLLGIGADTNTLGMTVNPGEVWSVDFTNPGTGGSFHAVTLSAYVSAPGYTGWVIRPQDGEETIHEGTSKTMSWDLTACEILTLTGNIEVTITSISKLGLVFIGDVHGGGEDFSIQVGSAEAYTYDVWLEEQYPDLVEAGRTNNPDGDALDNWSEYAFGGNPTNAADTGYPLEYNVGETFITYLHAQRKGSEDLGYIVETSDDLVNGSWTNGIVTVIGTNEIFSTPFAVVTIHVPLDVAQRFIRNQAVEK